MLTNCVWDTNKNDYPLNYSLKTRTKSIYTDKISGTCQCDCVDRYLRVSTRNS